MRVLVTNDDGIDAVGIRVLAAALAARGLDPVVAAPRTDSSGTSAALRATEEDGRVPIARRDLDGLAGYAIDGSPAYITLLALRGAFGPSPTWSSPGSTGARTRAGRCCTRARSAPR